MIVDLYGRDDHELIILFYPVCSPSTHFGPFKSKGKTIGILEDFIL